MASQIVKINGSILPHCVTVLLVGAVLAACGDRTANRKTEDAGTVAATIAALRRMPITIAGRPFSLELALDDASRHRGLSDRQEISADGGMLFAFPWPQRLTFVMRRCNVPIDLIFLDPNGYVIRMHRMTVEANPAAPDHRLRSYRSFDPALFAIELRGGTLDQLNLELADRIDLPIDCFRRLVR